MSALLVTANNARLNDVVRRSPPYLRPLFEAVRDFGVILGIAPQSTEPLPMPPGDRAAVLLVGDDMLTAKGPDGFHRKTLRKFIRQCDQAVIVSCEPPLAAYAAAATGAVFGRNVVLVETRLEQEVAWKEFIETARPGIALLIATVEPMGGIQ